MHPELKQQATEYAERHGTTLTALIMQMLQDLVRREDPLGAGVRQA